MPPEARWVRAALDQLADLLAHNSELIARQPAPAHGSTETAEAAQMRGRELQSALQYSCLLLTEAPLLSDATAQPEGAPPVEPPISHRQYWLQKYAHLDALDAPVAEAQPPPLGRRRA